MPIPKTRTLFISHAWRYEEHYWKVIQWFNDEPNFDWKNCSVPSTDSLPDKTSRGLSEAITRQINPSQAVIFLGGMYAAHSDWIDYEIGEAMRMQKIIIGVRPWGAERVPIKVQQAAESNGMMVNWQSSSIIQAVRNLV